jgi:hypothetical protein
MASNVRVTGVAETAADWTLQFKCCTSLVHGDRSPGISASVGWVGGMDDEFSESGRSSGRVGGAGVPGSLKA